MSEINPLYERRRYSAVLLTHRELGTIRAVRALLGKSAVKAKRIPVDADGAAVQRVEYRAQKNLYPSHLAPKETPGGSGFPHFVYLVEGRTRVDARRGPFLLLASPYVRLLAWLVRDLAEKISPPLPHYVAPKLEQLFEYMSSYRSGLRATRVTVQLSDEIGLELVSLSGRNPLRSDLHAEIRRVADPYSLRVEVEGGSGTTNVYADRHGNFWFYLTSEARIGNVVNYIDRLGEASLLRSVATLPLKREPGEE